MGQQVSVETLSSSVDSNGNRYWASFDPYPFKAGNRKLAYMGMLNGNGPLSGKKCVVKAIRKGNVSKQEWIHEVERARYAQQMASYYNEVLDEHEFRMVFNCPVLAEIDQLSDCICLSDIVGKPKKNMKEMDFVSLERFIRGRFEDFEYGWVHPFDLEGPEAFSHYSWCRSEGELLISNLQGVKTSVDYQLTGPVIHSNEMKYGAADLGLDGIKGFFRLHECNRLCNKWPRLGDGRNLKNWGIHSNTVTEEKIPLPSYPTAPPLPPPYIAHLPLVPTPQSGQTQNQQFGLGPDPRLRPQFGQMPPPPFGQIPNQQFGQAFDWRSQVYSAGAMDTTGYQGQSQVLPYMWYMQQMSYAFVPPPPYCACRAMRCGCAHDGSRRESFSDSFSGNNSDTERLLPLESAEKISVSDQDCKTYL